jgi:hypothetical protein
MWSNKYIGIPFKSQGRDYSGVDCWGLVRLVYKEQYNIDLPSFAENYHIEDSKRIQELIAQYKEGWQKLEIPEPGCIALFRTLGTDTHVAVMINNTEFIHSREGYDVAMGTITGTRWATRLLGFFKYVETTKAKLEELPVALETKTFIFEITANTPLIQAVNKLLQETGLKQNNIIILLNGTKIPPELWEKVILQHTDIITYRQVPGREAARLLIVLVAVYIAVQYGVPALELGKGAAAVFTSGVAIAASYAANAIFPVRPDPEPGNPGSSENQVMVQGGANRANPYGAIPVVLGKVRLTPPLAAENYITYPEERTSYLTTAVAWGFGPLNITDQKIGEVVTSNYTIKDQITLTGYNDSQASLDKFNQLYARDTTQDFKNVPLTCPGNPEGTYAQTGTDEEGNPVNTLVPQTPGIFIVSTKTGTFTEVAIALHMPQGMRKIVVKGANAGTSQEVSVGIELQYSINNGVTWLPWETFNITGTKKDAYTIVKTKTFATSTPIQIRARRTTGDNTEDNPDYRYYHEVIFLNATYTSNTRPIQNPKNSFIAKSAYVIQAQNQLNGQLEGINALVQSRCRPISENPGSTYSLPTSNPAALFFHILTHPANPQRILDSEINEKINIQQLQYWYTYCDTPRSIAFFDDSIGSTVEKFYKYEYNGVIAEQRSILEVLRDICAAGRASPAMIDGKWTVTIDEPKSTIVQHFSPHNSWGFEGTRALPKEPDGLKVTFYDEEQNYQQAETIVYNATKNINSAELFESITLPGVTNKGLVVDHAKWHFAQFKYRREIYSLNADIEYLACNRGDRVKVTHDVPAWGLGSGRIKQIYTNSSNNINIIELDETLPLQFTTQYTIRIRSKTGQSTTSEVGTQFTFSGYTRTGNTITITLGNAYGTVPFDESNPITIESTDNSINIINKTVSINRQNKTISYSVQTTGANGFTPTAGTIKLNLSDYKYLILQSPPAVNSNLITAGDLFMFGELNQESQDLIVLSIEPAPNKTARLTLIDYGVTLTSNIFQDYKYLTSDNVFQTLISLPPQLLRNSFNNNQLPLVTNVYSDDSAVEIISPGVYKYNIKISYATQTDLPTTTKFVQCEYMYELDTDITNTKVITSEYFTNTLTITDVIAGEQYKYRLRYVTTDNIVGPWTQWSNHTVVGITTNKENIASVAVIRLGKYLRIAPFLTVIPSNFKYFRIKIFKDNGTGDFWTNTNTSIKTVTTAASYIDYNILEFASPRISEAGIKYRIACRLVDTAGNESAVSALNSITLTTINP